MPIECNQWPMNILTRASGEKNRVLLVHPKPAVERKGIRRDKEGKLRIIDPKAIKIKLPNIVIPELKEAGHRHIFGRCADGKYVCYGRRLNVQNTYTDIWPKIQSMPHPKLPKETAIDFELVWPGHHDSEVVTAIKECPEELCMRCFALPIEKGISYIGEQLDYIQGRHRLLQYVNKANVTKRYKPISIGKDNAKEVLEYLLNAAENMKVEGFVLKVFHCAEWYKLKGIQEADVFITGFKVSTAETRKGMVTAVKVSVWDGKEQKYIGNVSGFNFEEMEAMTKAYNKYKEDSFANPYMGKVLRIIYQEMAGQGGLKHAFRDCWREDKNSFDCSIGQFS